MQYTREQELLRQMFLAEAAELAAGFEKDPNILAAFLTGSAAWGKPNPDGDLDVLLITRNSHGVFYRYLIPKFCRTPRRAEFGFIPLEVILGKINSAYADSISCSTIEQFKNGRILFQKDGQGDRIAQACRDAIPSKILIGKHINKINGLLSLHRQTLESGRHRTVLLTSRKIMSLTSRLLLLVRDHLGVAKEKQEFRAVNKIFGPAESASYEAAMSVANIDREKSNRVLAHAIALIGHMLLNKAVSDRIVSYNGIH